MSDDDRDLHIVPERLLPKSDTYDWWADGRRVKEIKRAAHPETPQARTRRTGAKGTWTVEYVWASTNIGSRWWHRLQRRRGLKNEDAARQFAAQMEHKGYYRVLRIFDEAKQ